MATYSLVLSPSFSYEDHLIHNAYISDISKGISQAAYQISYGQERIAETIQQNASFLSSVITGGANQISNDVRELTGVVEFGLEKVADGIAGLRADFNIAMGQVITQFEMKRSEMKAGFDRLAYLLENKRKIANNSLKFIKDSIIKHDNNYCVKVTNDPDFDALRQDVNSLLQKIKDQTLKEINFELSNLDRKFNPLETNMQTEIDSLWYDIDKLVSKDTYFSFIEAREKLQELKKAIKTAGQMISHKYKPCISVTCSWETFLQHYSRRPCGLFFEETSQKWIPSKSPMQIQAERELVKAKELLSEKIATNYDRVIENAKSMWVKIGGSSSKTIESLWKDPPEGWISFNEFNLIVKKQIEEKETKEILPDEVVNIEKGNCLKCHKPIDFWGRLIGMNYCRLHR